MTTLIIPIYNGDLYLEETFHSLQSFFAKNPFFQKVIFVNDGSSDTTSGLLTSLAEKSLVPIEIIEFKENVGKGAALKAAVAAASENDEYIVCTDGEIPYGFDVLAQSIDFLREHPDVQFVFGDRTKNTQSQYSLYRRIFTRLFRLCIPRAVRVIPDTQSGMKVFRAPVAKSIFASVETSRWVFDIELFLVAIRRGYHFYAMPVQIKPSCRQGKGGVTFFKHSFQILKDLKKIRTYDKQGHYLGQ